MEKTLSSQEISTLLSVNNLVYELDPLMSVTTQRILIKIYSSQVSYKSGDLVNFVQNTGAYNVDYSRSYGFYDIQAVGADCGFSGNGTGSGNNVLDETRVSARSGTELDHHTQKGLYNNLTYNWENNNTVVNNQGLAYGFGSASNVVKVATTKRIYLTAGMIATMFESDQLCPDSVARGMNIDIILADYRTALYNAAGTTTDYVITNFTLCLDCHKLDPRIQSMLNNVSLKEGLEWNYDRVYHTFRTQTGTSLNMDVKKKLSRAKHVWALSRVNAGVQDVKENSFTSEPIVKDTNSWSSVRWEVGAGNYYPQDHLRHPDDLYMYTSASFDLIQNPRKVGYVRPYTSGDQKFVIVGASLERSLEVPDGVPTSDARTLTLDAEFNDSIDRRIDLFIKYQNTAVIYPDNILTFD